MCNTGVNALVRKNPASKKSKKTVAFESPILADPQQAAHHVRSTRGCAANKYVSGQFVCIGITCMLV